MVLRTFLIGAFFIINLNTAIAEDKSGEKLLGCMITGNAVFITILVLERGYKGDDFFPDVKNKIEQDMKFKPNFYSNLAIKAGISLGKKYHRDGVSSQEGYEMYYNKCTSGI